MAVSQEEKWYPTILRVICLQESAGVVPKWELVFRVHLQDYAPPDLIDILVQKPIKNSENGTGDEESNSEDLELPEHLQKLVDKAMSELE